MNKELIKELAEGRIAVKNDGALEELNKVLKTAFPDAGSTNGIYPYFCKSILNVDDWISSSTINLPYYSVKDFLDTPTEKTLPRVMLVSDTNDIKTAVKRVVFAIKCGRRIAWNSVETIKESEEEIGTTAWIYAWELDELTIFPFNLSPTDAQSIIDIACNPWKVKLAEKWAINIVKKESITIPVEEYNEMYSACTDEQKELFNKIFK